MSNCFADESLLGSLPSLAATGDAIFQLGDDLARLADDLERITCRMLLMQSKLETCQRALAVHNKCQPRPHRAFPELSHRDELGP